MGFVLPPAALRRSSAAFLVLTRAPLFCHGACLSPDRVRLIRSLVKLERYLVTAGPERLYVTAAPSARRHAKRPITSKALIAERHWSPPTTNGRTSFLNGNVAWKEQLISRDEDDFAGSNGEQAEYYSYHLLLGMKRTGALAKS